MKLHLHHGSIYFRIRRSLSHAASLWQNELVVLGVIHNSQLLLSLAFRFLFFSLKLFQRARVHEPDWFLVRPEWQTWRQLGRGMHVHVCKQSAGRARVRREENHSGGSARDPQESFTSEKLAGQKKKKKKKKCRLFRGGRLQKTMRRCNSLCSLGFTFSPLRFICLRLLGFGASHFLCEFPPGCPRSPRLPLYLPPHTHMLRRRLLCSKNSSLYSNLQL